MSDYDKEVLEEFRNGFYEETLLQLEELENIWLKLESNFDLKHKSEAITLAFRVYHTIKGSAASVELKALSSLVHKLEDDLSLIRENAEYLSEDVVTYNLNFIDLLRKYVEELISSEDPETIEPTEEIKGICQKILEECKVVSPHKQEETSGCEDHKERFEGIEFNEEELKKQETLYKNNEVIEANFGFFEENLSDEQKEICLKKKDDVPEVAAPQTLKSKEDKVEKKDKKRKILVKIDADRINNLMELVGEMVVTKSQIVNSHYIKEIEDQSFNSLLLVLEKCVRELQEQSLQLKMTSLQPVMIKMMRTMKTTAKKLDKKIKVEIAGEETEMDRTIIDVLNDPLMHLCRNALDHGIEPPQQRREAGKPPVGEIQVIAGRRGGRIFLEVRDDGRGIDKEKILKKAKEKGIVDHKITEQHLIDSEIYDYLFHPGFSTADKVSDLSGRGVGMDVVKSQIESVKGKVEVESKLGVGSCFRLWIPLTTATTDGMVVEACSQLYVFPIQSIKELVRMNADKVLSTSSGTQVLNLRGSLTPLINLNSYIGAKSLKLEYKESEVRKDRRVAVVIEERKTKVAVIVDKVLGQSQVVIRGLEGIARNDSNGVAGAAILGNGKVGLILDAVDIVSWQRRQSFERALAKKVA